MQSGVGQEDGDSEWHEGAGTDPRDCRWHGKFWCCQKHIKSSRGGGCGGERSRGHPVPTAPKCQHTYDVNECHQSKDFVNVRLLLAQEQKKALVENMAQ